ncbi:MAG: 50S ribosomal protein L24 [bacterium]
MKIKVGDKVKLISGKDNGKSGKVLQILAKEKKLVVEGLNLMIKNQRGKKQGEKGQRIQFPAPVDVSNILLICPKCGRDVRVGYKVEPAVKGGDLNTKAKKFIKNRICKKCQENI